VTRHFGDIGPWRVLKSGHVSITKIEKLHIGTHIKIHLFQKCYSFLSMTKNNEVIAEKPSQNSGVTRRLALLNWRSSSIHPSSYYCYVQRNENCPDRRRQKYGSTAPTHIIESQPTRANRNDRQKLHTIDHPARPESSTLTKLISCKFLPSWTSVGEGVRVIYDLPLPLISLHCSFCFYLCWFYLLLDIFKKWFGLIWFDVRIYWRCKILKRDSLHEMLCLLLPFDGE